jgi:diguanylate cyclase (GGDEF)-like protein
MPESTEHLDERKVMSRTAGALWLTCAAVMLLGLVLPGGEDQHPWVAFAVLVPIGIHGVSCLLAIGWDRFSMTVHGVSAMLILPVIGVAQWATGGTSSYIEPLLLLTAIFWGWFYPPTWSWPLVIELNLIVASPIVWNRAEVADDNWPAWMLAFAATTIGTNLAVSRLKRRLVEAELRQRVMANKDPLTGLANRRAFDAALEQAIADARPFSLLFVDLDDFKGINDNWGHPVGDRVLREIAAHCSAVVREGDCLARIGGDEFAVVARGSRAEGARRLADALEEAVGQVTRGDGGDPVRATVTSAAYPDDGETVVDLMHVADGALHAQKRAKSPVADEA